MTTTVALRHRTEYRYGRRVTLGPQVVRLRPAPHTRVPIERYSMRVEPAGHFCNVQQDPYGNFQARLVFPEPTDHFSVTIELTAELLAVNPFDFFLEPSAEHAPFTYEPALAEVLAPYLATLPPEPAFEAFLETVSREPQQTVAFLVEVNQRLASEVKYIVRLEPGVQTPEETLRLRSGSCRDSSWLLVQLLRRLGLAARFVSGYLVQLVADVPSIDGPAGPSADFTDLHAWAEVFLPGAGWVGLDPTSGLFAGEGHIPLAATASPEDAAPVTGAFAFEPLHEDDKVDVEFGFEMSVERVRESPRASRRFDARTWEAVIEAGRTVDRKLEAAGLTLTMGGEPTFVSMEDPDGDEWNITALGPRKKALGMQLAHRLLDRLGSNGMLHVGQGKWYPGESLPRWAITVGWRRDGVALWTNRALVADESRPSRHGPEEAHRFALALVQDLGIAEANLRAAYEDALYYAWLERKLPVGVDPFDPGLDDPELRARMVRVFSHGLTRPVGYALPIETDGEGFRSGPWTVRDDKLFLIPGDSPMGYRLPLDSLKRDLRDRRAYEVYDPWTSRPPLPQRPVPAVTVTPAPEADSVRTALCIEPRGGMLHVFLPPLPSLDTFVSLVAAVERAAENTGLAVRLEGYLPPDDPRLVSLQVTPDPGVIEVNVQPVRTFDEIVDLTTTLYGEAAACKLGPDKFMVDGRHAGSGGGHHIVLGGPTASQSPFLQRPEILGSLLAYFQCHPSLSYLFSSLFIGPTSQHPRPDEARPETRLELELALRNLPIGATDKPWLVDRMLRDVLIDASGNTHRTEISIDKLYSPDGTSGRRGLVEFRGFEMSPDPQMSCVTQLLVRSLVARFAAAPFRGPLADFTTELHDRFLLPYHLIADLGEVLDDLREHGLAMDPAWFERHAEFRFPKLGSVQTGDLELELRSALEPWHVLGEEGAAAGTVRYVDASVERLQVMLRGAVPGRHEVFCNGRRVPLQPTRFSGERVAGVRYRAWQPPRCLHPTMGVHAPLVFELVDRHRDRTVAGCTYHVGHPGGRNYDTRPVNAPEAEGRRRARFSPFGATGVDVARGGIDPHRTDGRHFLHTLDLLRD